ncbi:hypothetical protein BHQ21_01735 [Mycobacterium sherrisii]|uniref:Uncharacterized protein n=1 Tax=Mycobacterium sherrisii TaxID=243061 RepID=A0A1E3T949_9MYCO|nr:hypothetical protein BHQ21_01735 [Mycobacterium sherrisii]
MPMIWVASATVIPTTIKKVVLSSRVGTPAARAMPGSMVANSNGRAIVTNTAVNAAAPTTAKVRASSLIPKMLPNKTFTFAVPLWPLPWLV